MINTIQNIKKELLVGASQATAFKVFTERMDLWWPKTHHVGATPMTELILEPHQNGRWYTRHEDGSEVTIGYVATYDPNDLLVLVWQIDGNFKCDPNLITEVEVQFIPEGERQTRVKFEHKDLYKLGGGNKVVQDMDNGWGMILNLYKNIAEQES